MAKDKSGILCLKFLTNLHPITTAAQGSTTEHPAVIATRPDNKPPTVYSCKWIKIKFSSIFEKLTFDKFQVFPAKTYRSKIKTVRAATPGAKVVLTATLAAT